jgi:hypothetical protein
VPYGPDLIRNQPGAVGVELRRFTVARDRVGVREIR